MAAAVGAAIAWVVAHPAIAIAVGTAVASAGYSVYALNEAKKAAQSQPSVASQKQMFRSATAPKQIVLGHAITSGPMIFAAERGEPNDKGEGEELHILVHIAGHPCEDVTHCWMNDEQLIPIGSSDPNRRAFKHSNESGWVYVYLGEQTEQLPSLNGLPDADGKMIGHGDTIAHIVMKSDPEKWPAGIPNVKFAVKGAKVPDPRSNETAWTDNPALLLRWYRSTLKHGAPIDESYIVAANICDEWVETPDDKLEKRYRCNYAFPCDTNPRTVMENIRATCAGKSLSLIGRHGMTVGAYYGGATVALTPADIVGDIKTQPDVRRRDRINTITATYCDPHSNWNEVDMPIFRHDEYFQRDGYEIVDDLDLQCCPSPYQAQRLASIHLLSIREGATLELPCNLKGFELLPGSTFKLWFPENGWEDVEFVVESWKFAHEHGVTLSVRQHLASNYAFNGSSAKVPTRPLPPTLHNPNNVEVVTNLSYRELVNDNIAQALISWQHRSYGSITYTIKIYQDGTLLRQDETKLKQYRLTDGFAPGSYLIEVLATNGYGASSTASLIFEAKAPQTPSGCELDIGNWSVTLSPIAGSDTNFDTLFDFAFGFEADVDPEIAIMGRARVLTMQNLKAETSYRYAVREVSRWGVSGWHEGELTTTNDSSDILEVIKDKITHEHLNAGLNDTLENIQYASESALGAITDPSRTTELLYQAYNEWKLKQEEQKQAIGFAYAERTIAKHTSDISATAEEILNLYVAVDDTLAAAQEYTRASVGYCIDKDGNITDDIDAVLCVQAGHSWIEGPLAEYVRNLAIESADGQQVSVNQISQAFITKDGHPVAKGGLTTTVNGHVSGMVNTNTGEHSALDFIADHSRFGVIEHDRFIPLMHLDSTGRQMVVYGRMVLGDGYEINSADDIKAEELGGVRFFTLILRDGEFPSDSVATQDFYTAYDRVPVNDDHLIYRNMDGSKTSIKRFDGNKWVAPALLLHGDLFAKGTVSADRLVANAEIESPKISGGVMSATKVLGGQININEQFTVDERGKLKLETASQGSSRLVIDGDRIDVYEGDALRVRIGRLFD